MTNIRELFSLELLQQDMVDGFVRRQVHPTLPLAIYNYTERAQYANHWDAVTSQCRGLIVNSETGEVVARPFRKFFNWGQAGCPDLSLDELVVVHNKEDGSLGVLYPTPTGPAISTRGSFTSDQALHATQLLREKYPEITNDWLPHHTALFEIVYPENRIVLDYGSTDDLVLLGAVHNETGKFFYPDNITWYGPRAEFFPYPTLGAALRAIPRANAEGLVVHVPRTDDFVKVKQDDYVLMHKMIFGLNARSVWEALRDGLTVREICEGLPDELHDWVRRAASKLQVQYLNTLARAMDALNRVVNSLPEGYTRKDFALAVKDEDQKSYLFALLDEKPIDGQIWKDIKPSADDKPFSGPSEDTA